MPEPTQQSGVVAQTYNPSTGKAETHKALGLRTWKSSRPVMNSCLRNK